MKRIIYLIGTIVIILVVIGFSSDQPSEHNVTVESESVTLNNQATSSPPVKRGKRMIFVDPIDDKNVGFGNISDALEKARINGVPFTANWDDIEQSPGVYAEGWYSIADSFYGEHNYSVATGLMSIDTIRRRVPKDIAERHWNDPEVIARYVDAADHVIRKTPNLDLVSFSVGNEVDVYLRQHPTEWGEYREFFKKVRAELKKAHPNLKFGVKMTFDGLTKFSTEDSQNLNADSDVILVTYYPMDDRVPGKLRVRNPDAPLVDFPKLALLYPDKEIQILEAGYPSSIVVGSSEELQSDFIRYLFDAWDKEKQHITIITLFCMNDFSESLMKSLTTYYDSTTNEFAGFLGSLGLHFANGKEKKSWTTMKEEMHARGW